MTEEIVAQATPNPDERLNPSDTLKKLEACLAKLDSQIKVGEQATELQDFLQDDLMPNVVSMSREIITLMFYISRHEDQLADLESGASQLTPTDANVLLEHLTECNALLEKIAAVQAIPGMNERIAKGKELMEFVRSITLEDEEESQESDDDAE